MKKTMYLLTTAMLCASLMGCGSTSSPQLSTAEQGNAESQESETNNKATETPIAAIDEIIVFDEDGIRITATGIENEDFAMGAEVKFLIENNSSTDITVQARNVSVNGYMVDTSMSADVVAGKKNNTSLTILNSSLNDCGISEIAEIDVSFHIFNSSDWETIRDTDMITIKTSIADTYTQNYDDSGDVVYEDENVRIIAKGISEDEIMGLSAIFYIENLSDKALTVQARDTSVNGFMLSPTFSADVSMGKKSIDDMTFLSTELEENNIEEISDIETSFHIFESESMDTIVDTDTITIKY